jgi:hypothetical protein
VERNGDRVRLLSKSGLDWTKRYPWIVETARKIRKSRFILDGEAVVLGVCQSALKYCKPNDRKAQEAFPVSERGHGGGEIQYWCRIQDDPLTLVPTGSPFNRMIFADTLGLCAQMRQRRLAEIQRHVLRVSCRRCERTVEIQTVGAIRLYGGNALWKQIGQRLLDDTCQERTGRHEEDGCWPTFDTP